MDISKPNRLFGAMGLTLGLALLAGIAAIQLGLYPEGLQGRELIFQVPMLLLAAGSFVLSYLTRQAGLEKSTNPVTPIIWRTVERDTDVRDLLSWNWRLGETLVGRADEEQDLLDWAKNGGGVKVRFLSGSGGVGKTRLAAEVAHKLAGEGWTAGLARDDAHELLATANHRCLFLIVDYPENNLDRAEQLLNALVDDVADGAGPVRALLVSRYSQEDWEERFSAIDNKIGGVREIREPLTLLELDTPQASQLFTNAVDSCAAARGLGVIEVSAAKLEKWLDGGPDKRLFHLPLFVTAAALHCVFEAERRGGDWDGFEVGLSAAEVMSALVKRETRRMDTFGKERGRADKNPLVKRLVALATVRSGLDAEALENLKELAPDELVFPSDEGVVGWARGLDWWNKKDHRFDPLRPDVLGAALVFEVFREWEKKAPEWLWGALSTVPEEKRLEWLAAAERIDYDIRRIHGWEEKRFAGWLAGMVAGKLERAQALEYVTRAPRVAGTVMLGDVIGGLLLDGPGLDEEMRAELLHNRSVHLRVQGKNREALEAIQEAVDIRRRLASQQPNDAEGKLAGSLVNYSACLGEEGRMTEALVAIEEAVQIYRGLPERYEPELATSQMNYSVDLTVQGRGQEALEAAEAAVTLYRRLPTRFEAQLARSLANYSNCLGVQGRSEDALKAVDESVKIHRRLAIQFPERYEPDLAVSLANYSKRLGEQRRGVEALETIEESVEIRRRLAVQTPERYEPDLSSCLTNYSDRLSERGRGEQAGEIIAEAVVIRRRLSKQTPERYEPDLALSLSLMGEQAEAAGDFRLAVKCHEEAVDLFRKHRNRSPGFAGRLLPSVEKDLERLRGLLGEDG